MSIKLRRHMKKAPKLRPPREDSPCLRCQIDGCTPFCAYRQEHPEIDFLRKLAGDAP